MFYLLFFLMLLPYVYGGSQCPPRADIHPCICIDRPIGKKKFDTTVVCHGLNDGSSLLTIESALSEMEINRFLLYDSYWSTDLRKFQTDSDIPVNYLSSFRMDEIKVVDTGMSSFACPAEYNCKTSYLKRFTAINSTLTERSSCENNGFTINAWISCPGIVEQVTIDEGFPNNMSIKPDFFPKPMPKLKALHMPRNHISRIDKRTFNLAKFPSLQILDLSHNYLRDAKYLFSAMLKLKYLDLSFNSIRTVSDFQYLPHLQTLKLSDNHITSLLPNEWQNMPVKLRHIDLTNNNVNCGCGVQFINSTFHVNAVLLGTCASPDQVKGTKLRKASRFLIERCDEAGNIGVKRKASHHAQV